MAREIGVLFDRAVRVPDPRPATSGARRGVLASVRVEAPDLCPRFTARVLTGVKVGPSPWWLRKRLETLGVRPISNVVDVTNYVMFESGQPLHAYDLARLGGRTLVPRRALAGETLRAINGKAYDLTSEMLVIADESGPVGPGRGDGGAGHRDRPGDDRGPPRGRPVRPAERPQDLEGPRPPERFELPVRAADRPRGDRVGQPPRRRTDPGDGGRDAPPGPDRRRHVGADRPPITLRLDQITRVLGIAVEPGEVRRILLALGLEADGGPPEAPRFRAPSWRSDLDARST